MSTGETPPPQSVQPASESEPLTSEREQTAPEPNAPEQTAPESEVAAESEVAEESPKEPTAQRGSANKPRSAARPLARGSGPLAARGLGVAKPASPSSPATSRNSGESQPTGETSPPASAEAKSSEEPKSKSTGKQYPRPRLGGEKEGEPEPARPTHPAPAGKVQVPSTRQSLPTDLQAELEAELAAADVESMLGGAAGMADRREPLEEGTRVQGQILKVHGDSAFVALGGPDEGIVPLEYFTDQEPQPGQTVEVVVRGFNADDGLYVLTLPGQTVDVSDWSDLEEGSVVEATVTGSNTGGLECTVGSVQGFMPISQIADYRVEDPSEFVGQKLVCVVNEANPRRGNLVLSHRAILERQREEKRKEQLEKIKPGDTLEGTVRSVKDFGAFVDLGGLDGLIHVSKLSWERIKHPSEVMEEGQKVKVKVDTVDKQTGKIGLSYRDLLENPWDTAERDFPVGSTHRGTVTRTAAFGCFVRLAPGVEGLVHISELAHHRVSKVDALVKEGEEVEVKVLSFDRESQRIGLSIKAAQTVASDSNAAAEESEPEAPLRDPAIKPSHAGPLRGGNDRETGGERFGLRW